MERYVRNLSALLEGRAPTAREAGALAARLAAPAVGCSTASDPLRTSALTETQVRVLMVGGVGGAHVGASLAAGAKE